MKIVMIGTGYVGLVTGACFAETGHHVVCCDASKAKIDGLLAGQMPIYEPGLEALVSRNVIRRRIHFTNLLSEAMACKPEFVFITVGTPPNIMTGHADLSFVYAAIEEVSQIISTQIAQNEGSEYTVIVTKSTVPVGTGIETRQIVKRYLSEERFSVVSNPEFLREGMAIKDFLHPDRIVIGSTCDRARKMMEKLYKPLTNEGYPLIMTSNTATAELIKYAANSFLVTKISFINELARLCEKVDAKVDELACAIGLDQRIGSQFLNVGPGYGGSCFPKDTLALIKTAADYGSPMSIVEAVVKANDVHQHFMVEKIRHIFGGLKGRRLGILGLTFKANTDDVRDSPSLIIVPALRDEGAEITAYDPKGNDQARQWLDNITISDSPEAVFDHCDAVIILTEWPQFKQLPWQTLRETMRRPVLVDLRNLLNPQEMFAQGFEYYSLGR